MLNTYLLTYCFSLLFSAICANVVAELDDVEEVSEEFKKHLNEFYKTSRVLSGLPLPSNEKEFKYIRHILEIKFELIRIDEGMSRQKTEELKQKDIELKMKTEELKQKDMEFKMIFQHLFSLVVLGMAAYTSWKLDAGAKVSGNALLAQLKSVIVIAVGKFRNVLTAAFIVGIIVATGAASKAFTWFLGRLKGRAR